MLLRHLPLAVFGALCVLAGPVWAQAQPAAGILNAFGFFGSWAVQCGAPPSPANVVLSVTWTGREPVEYSETPAPGRVGNRYRVVSAQMPNATTLLLQVQLNDRDFENLTIARYGDSAIRTMANQTSRGFLVQNGVVLASGQQTPWLRKCR